MDVARQTTKPALSKSGPQHQTDEGNDRAEDEQHFAQLVQSRVNLIPNGRPSERQDVPLQEVCSRRFVLCCPEERGLENGA